MIRGMALPVYRGPFGVPQAERLLWRAGFGPRPGEAKRLAGKGLEGAVRTLTRPPGRERLVGPAPKDQLGQPIAPYDAFGHDHLWWLDRMVRTSRPLVERMALVWHDWFATSNAGVVQQKLMLGQNALFRRHALGSFANLLVEVTRDPAMLVWLNGNRNTKRAPNENYARELMELFTLGAGRGYTETDVREQARALTGWTNSFTRGVGKYDFRYDPRLHDDGAKTVFGKRGNFEWEDTCRLCVRHPLHPSFFVTKLWSYFVPTPPSAADRRELEKLYRADYQVRPVLEAILRHPALHEGPRMVKPPVVYTAGLLRTLGRGVDTAAWITIGSLSGQRLFYPPNVAGWDERRWLDTATFRGRWLAAARVLRPLALDERAGGSASADPDALVERALAFWRGPRISAETRGVLLGFARRALDDGGSPSARARSAVAVENALRQLVAVSPDLQSS
jgi:uncharacterized protein (DUF1800 family)